MNEIQESHSQMVAFWNRIATALDRPEIESRDGLEILFGNVPIPFFNVACLLEPVSDEHDLANRLRAATEFAEPRQMPWFLFAADLATPGELAGLRDAKFAEAGLHPAMRLTGMIAEANWSPNEPPEGLTMKVAGSADAFEAINDINTIAYEMPPGAGVGIMDRPALFAGGAPVVGYRAGEAVSCAHTVPLDDRLYVAFVATLPTARRRGFAEACMRQSLAEAAKATGLRRSVLHATDAGRPIYERMGYRPVTTYTVFGQAH